MNAVIFMGIIGGQELIVIIVLVLLLFGGKKIPELMRGLGKGIREFKDATNSANEQIMKEFRDTPTDASSKEKDKESTT